MMVFLTAIEAMLQSDEFADVVLLGWDEIMTEIG